VTLRDGELETAREIALALEVDEVSPTEPTDRALGRAQAWQPAINAFSQLWPQEAHAAAGGGRSGPWFGVPVAVKDLFDVAGHETTGCSELYRGQMADSDAPTISAVRSAGLVMVGKTNQHELAAGGTNAVSACGPARNPWDVQRITGGSSGGSAAAVAAGIVPWGLGSDTGGSIRIPASLCGTFGLKPTTGRLSIQGMLPLAPSMDCPGPLASTAADLWTLFAILAGLEVPCPGEDRLLDSTAGRLRIAVVEGFFRTHVHPEVTRAVEGAAMVLAGAGVRVDTVPGDGIDDARWTWTRTCFPEFAAAHPRLREHPELVAPPVRAWAEEGASYGSDELEQARVRRNEIGRWFRVKLEGFDALLIPTTPYPATRLGQDEVDLGPAGVVPVELVGPGRLTSSINLTGLPALSFPAGRSAEGLPIGASLVGRDDDEATLARIAALWEAASGHLPERPAATPAG
jgi:aspartyl-tRNA(Asn)/glutamyl-tRNA(Gln) amidotransferase subunit A